MVLEQVNTKRLGMSVIPGITRVTPPSAGAGLAGMGDMQYSFDGGTTVNTLTTTQLVLIGLAAWFILRR